jgi:hypothetical protein
MWMDDKEAEKAQAQQRRETAMGIAQQNAASLGAPSTAGLTAARTMSSQSAADAARQRSNVSNIASFAAKSYGAEGADEAGGAVDQDLQNNPPGPGAEEYIGAQMGPSTSSVYDAADSALADYGRGPMDRPTDINRPMPPRMRASDTELLDPWQDDEDDEYGNPRKYGGGGMRY